jgi:uncharacterized protein
MKQVNHPDIQLRLKRALGHLQSVVNMFDAERSCTDTVQQLHAVENAISNAKRQLIQDHLEHCLGHDAEAGCLDPKKALQELRALSKYF